MKNVPNVVLENERNISSEEVQNENSCNVLHEIQNLNKNKLINKPASSEQFGEYEYRHEAKNARKKSQVR